MQASGRKLNLRCRYTAGTESSLKMGMTKHMRMLRMFMDIIAGANVLTISGCLLSLNYHSVIVIQYPLHFVNNFFLKSIILSRTGFFEQRFMYSMSKTIPGDCQR